MDISLKLREAGSVLAWMAKTLLLRKKTPLIGVVIPNNTCNLQCTYCPVKHLEQDVVPYEQIVRDLEALYRSGARFLIVTGGEPLLWHDDDKTLEDVIRRAKAMGMHEIVLCTNGTLPLDTTADYVLVSLDGDRATHDRIRGPSYRRIMKNIKASGHKHIYVQFTVNADNHHVMEQTVRELQRHHKIRGILFSVYVPYRGAEGEGLTREHTDTAIDRLIDLKKRHPDFVVNTTAALRHLKRDDWERPTWINTCIYDGEVSPCCCRGDIVTAEICAGCQLAACVESYVIQRMEPSALLEYLKYAFGPASG